MLLFFYPSLAHQPFSRHQRAHQDIGDHAVPQRPEPHIAP